MFPILLQPMCSIKTSGVTSFDIDFICLHVFQSDAYNRVIHLSNFKLNFFCQIPLIILIPRIYTFPPSFTALLKSVMPGTIDVAVFFTW